jgi:hypothetical protein
MPGGSHSLLGKGYGDFGLHPVGQDMGGFQHEEGGNLIASLEGEGIPLIKF